MYWERSWTITGWPVKVAVAHEFPIERHVAGVDAAVPGHGAEKLAAGFVAAEEQVVAFDRGVSLLDDKVERLPGADAGSQRQTESPDEPSEVKRTTGGLFLVVVHTNISAPVAFSGGPSAEGKTPKTGGSPPASVLLLPHNPIIGGRIG